MTYIIPAPSVGFLDHQLASDRAIDRVELESGYAVALPSPQQYASSPASVQPNSIYYRA
jgi:hypothetical protein